MRERKRKRASKYFVNVYRTERAYGGPEEGGWWYNKGEYLGSYGMYAEGRANLVRERVRKLYKDEPKTYHMGYGDHDGVDSSGEADDNYLIRGGSWGSDNIEIVIENKEGCDYPRYRPTWDY